MGRGSHGVRDLSGDFARPMAPLSLMYWFDDRPQGFNTIGPHKTLKLTLSPSQIWSGGKPFAAIGTPGAWRILQTTPQLFQSLLWRELDIQSSIEAPRFLVLEGRRIALVSRGDFRRSAQKGSFGGAAPVMGPSGWRRAWRYARSRYLDVFRGRRSAERRRCDGLFVIWSGL